MWQESCSLIGIQRHVLSTEPNEDRQITLVTYKGKAIPLQPWTGPEGSSSSRIPDVKTVGT